MQVAVCDLREASMMAADQSVIARQSLARPVDGCKRKSGERVDQPMYRLSPRSSAGTSMSVSRTYSTMRRAVHFATWK